MPDIEKPVDLEKLRHTFTVCPNCKKRIEAAAEELEILRPVCEAAERLTEEPWDNERFAALQLLVGPNAAGKPLAPERREPVCPERFGFEGHTIADGRQWIACRACQPAELSPAAQALEASATIIRLERELKRLWSLLDDISAAGDWFKPKINSYFRYVNAKCESRDGIITSDGYKLLIDADWLRNKTENDPDDESCEAGGFADEADAEQERPWKRCPCCGVDVVGETQTGLIRGFFRDCVDTGRN